MYVRCRGYISTMRLRYYIPENCNTMLAVAELSCCSYPLSQYEWTMISVC